MIRIRMKHSVLYQIEKQDPEPYQSEKQDPDQKGLDLQHWLWQQIIALLNNRSKVGCLGIEMSVTYSIFLIIYRRVSFDVAVEGQPFIHGLNSLDKAIGSFLSLCFVAHLEYPPVRNSNSSFSIHVLYRLSV